MNSRDCGSDVRLDWLSFRAVFASPSVPRGQRENLAQRYRDFPEMAQPSRPLGGTAPRDVPDVPLSPDVRGLEMTAVT